MEKSNFLISLEQSPASMRREIYINKFHSYKQISFEGDQKQEWYIEANNKIINPKSPTRKSMECAETDILISIINLAIEIDKNDGFDDQYNSDLKPTCIQEILGWCKIYGIPYHDADFWEEYLQNNNSNNFEDISGFGIILFKERILELYKIFLALYGLTTFDYSLVIEHMPYILEKCNLKEEDIPNYYALSKIFNHVIPILKDILTNMVSKAINGRISLCYDKEHERFFIFPDTDDLISVAYHQLSFLMSEADLKKVKLCTKCKKFFEADHGSTKMCPQCKRDYNRDFMREKRSRK